MTIRRIPLAVLIALTACGDTGPTDEEPCGTGAKTLTLTLETSTPIVGSSQVATLSSFSPSQGVVIDFSGPIAIRSGTSTEDMPEGESTIVSSQELTVTCTAPGPAQIHALYTNPKCEEEASADLVCTAAGTTPTTPTDLECTDALLLDQRTVLTDVLGADGCSSTVTTTDQSDPFHPDGQTTAQPTDHTGIIAWMAGVGTLDQPTVDALFDPVTGLYPCGQDATHVTSCASYAPADFPPGPVHVFAMSFAEDIPLDDGIYYQFGFAFDTDGDLSNNRPSQPPYDYSHTDGTDLSFVVHHDPNYAGSPWWLGVIDWSSGVLTYRESTSARILIRGNTVVLVAPSTDYATAWPDIRFFTFSHPGDWGYGGVWSADAEPPVTVGLHSWTP